MDECKHRFRTIVVPFTTIGFYTKEERLKRGAVSWSIRTVRCDDCGAVFDERVEARG